MQVTDDTYIHCVWFVSLPDSDMLGYLFKEGEGPWEVEYRFRHYVDDKTWGSQDLKNFYSVKGADASEKTRDELEFVMDLMAERGVSDFSAELTKLVIEGGTDKLHEVMSQQPWCSIKTGKPGQSREDVHAEAVVEQSLRPGES